MELTPSQKKTVRHQFDSFCKKVLREEARDYYKQLARRSEQEASLSELSEEQLERLYVLDEYPSDATLFDVQGYDVAISNEKLADALSIRTLYDENGVPHLCVDEELRKTLEIKLITKILDFKLVRAA